MTPPSSFRNHVVWQEGPSSIRRHLLSQRAEDSIFLFVFSLFFFFVKPRYPRRWPRLIPQSGWQGLPKRPSADEEEGRTPNLVSDESMSTAPPGPLRYVFTVDCSIGQIVARKYGIRNFINFLKAVFNFKNK